MPDIGNGQSWYGILVDARCSGSGMTGESKSGQTGDQNMMNRNTPSGTSGRTWNTTDRNTSGTADRGATGTGAASNPATANSDMNPRTPDATTGMDRRDNSGSATGSTGTTDRASADNRNQDNRSGQTSQLPRSTAQQMDQSGASPSNTNTAGAIGGSADRQSNTGNWNTTGDVATPTHAGGWNASCFINPASNSFMLHTKEGRTIQLDDASNSKIASQLQSTQRVQTAHKIFRVRVSGKLSGDRFSITDIQM